MRNRYTTAFKAKIVLEAIKEVKTLAQIASENSLHPNQISQWKAVALSGMPTLFERESKLVSEKADYEQKAEELYAQIGKLSAKLEWVKKKSGVEPP